MDEQGRKLAGAYVKEALDKQRKNRRWLEDETGLTFDTVSDMLNGVRWPRVDTRNSVEDALGLKRGSIERAANGVVDPLGDPVEQAIADSTLSRADKAELVAHYFRLVDAEEAERRA